MKWIKKCAAKHCFRNHVNEKLLTYSNFVRNQVEYKISTILYEADMGYYDKPLFHIGSNSSSSYQYSPPTEVIPSPLPSPRIESSTSSINHAVHPFGKDTSHITCLDKCPNNSSRFDSTLDIPATSPQTSTGFRYETFVSETVANENSLAGSAGTTFSTDIYQPFSR